MRATMEMRVARCARCHTQIVHVQTTSGYWMWIDADPDPEGTITIRDGIGVVVSPQTNTVRHRPHRASCEARTSGPSGKAPANPANMRSSVQETGTDPTDPSIPAPAEPEPEPDDDGDEDGE